MVMDYGALTGNSNALLSLLGGLLPYTTDNNLALLSYMNAVGQVNPSVFGVTDPTVARSLLPGGPTLQQQQLNQQAAQAVQAYNLQQQSLAQQAELARAELAQRAAQSQNELGIQRELGLGGLDVQRQGNDITRELGLGNLDVSRGTLALNRELGLGDLALRGELGRGQLQLGQQQLQADIQNNQRSQALQGMQLLGQRATRQLAAPGGNVVPTLAPIIGRSRI